MVLPMALHASQCLVTLQIGARRLSATVAWIQDDSERVVTHRSIECDWATLNRRGRQVAIAEVIDLAASSAGVEVFSVFVAIADPSLRANFASGFVDLGQEMTFTEEDRFRSLARATHQAIGTDREVLHALPQHWAIRNSNGESAVPNPVGQRGTRLTCHVLLVTVLRDIKHEIASLLAEMQIALEGLIAPPVALYRGMSSTLHKSGSSVIIDIGARHTHLMVHRKGRLIHLETHRYGGDDITERIAHELDIGFSQAEEMKCGVDLSARARGTDPDGQTYLWRDIQERQRLMAPTARVCDQSLRAFLGERARILRDHDLLSQRGRVHLVGRGAALGGLRELVAELFAMPVVLGTNTNDREISTELTDLMTVGLIRQAASERAHQLRERGGSSIHHVTTAAASLWHWLMAPTI